MCPKLWNLRQHGLRRRKAKMLGHLVGGHKGRNRLNPARRMGGQKALFPAAGKIHELKPVNGRQPHVTKVKQKVGGAFKRAAVVDIHP